MRKTRSTYTLQKASRLLARWDHQFGESISSVAEDESAHRALLESFVRDRDIEPFDCLLIADWEPTEEPLSDVIAALFNSNWGHPFAVPILQHVLGTLVSNGSMSASKLAKCQHILNSLDPKRTQIFVRRERGGDSSISDIDVYTRGPDAFFVCIEHKIRGNKETDIGGKKQTVRLWEDAEERAKQLDIDPHNVVGIFLTPSGEPAACQDFGVLSFREFGDAAFAAVADEMGGAERTSRAAASILGFMSFYGRI